MRDALYIDGVWANPLRGGTLPVVDPATEKVIHHLPAATAEDVDAAVKAARRAFDHGPWPRLSGIERAACLRRIAVAIRTRLAASLRAGIIWINCSQPTFTEAPWGGFKQSGIGRELGRWGFENYLETKQITRLVSDEPWAWYLK